jgi:sodium pump decarboxylase gamma subunit
MNVWMMLQVMILGLGTVFVVLVLLIGMIWLINKLLSRDSKKEKISEIQVESPAAAETAEEEGDALIAVITAAVCAGLHTSTHNFRVHSIRERKSRWGRR